MSLDYSKQISIPCPKCGHKHSKSLRWIQDNNRGSMPCVCGVNINLNADELLQGFSDIEKRLQSFLKGFGK